MPTWDERYQGKKPEKKLDPGKFSILRKAEDTETIRRNAAPVAVTGGSSARTRAARSSSEPEHAAFTMDTWDASVRAEKERARKRAAEAEQRERNIAAQQERDRIAHEHARARDAELKQQQAAMQDVAKALLSHRVETTIIERQIQDVCEAHSLTLEQVQVIGARLKTMGCEKMPALWDYEARQLLEKRNHEGN